MKTYTKRLFSMAAPLMLLGAPMMAQAGLGDGTLGAGSTGALAGEPMLRVMPERVTVVKEVPERVELLSLNNSLINFQGQDTIWNRIAASMGKDAAWTPHTCLGQPLSYHWMETDDNATNSEGQPSAKTMIKMKPWTHIILQEQTERPRLDFEDFRKNVTRWVNFIRENCPNPHAVIILPVNWALTSSLDTYSETINLVIDNYLRVAQELGVVLAPVSSAYRLCYERDGEAALKQWYMDDRHPTMASAYLAACIEYATIYGEDPTTIRWKPYKVSDLEAMRVREYAKLAMTDFAQVVDLHRGTVQLQCVRRDASGQETEAQAVTWLADNGGAVDAHGCFTCPDAVGDYTVRATDGTLSAATQVRVAQAVKRLEGLPTVEMAGAEAVYRQDFDAMGTEYDLPEGWRMDCQTGFGRNLGYFPLADDHTMWVQQPDAPTLDAEAESGSWNFGSLHQRAIGGLASGRSGAPRVINAYLHIRNTGATPISHPLLSYAVEKFRKGKNPAGFDVCLYTSSDGVDWQVADAEVFKTHFDADDATAGYTTVPGEVKRVSGELPVSIRPGDDLFLAWNIRVATGYSSGDAMALAIDEVCLNGLPETDDITSTPRQETRDDAPRFNLSGQRVTDNYRGVVVSAGQKWVQK